MKIEIYSDMVCPFCYIGEVKLNQAIAMAGISGVETEFKAFQLYQSAPADTTMHINEFFKLIYGDLPVDMSQALEHVRAAGRNVGLSFNYDIMQSCNTLKAHRLSKWAKTYGKQTEMILAIMDGFFTKGKKLNENGDLLEMVRALGLDASEAETVLNSDRFLEDVKRDLDEASRLDITSVPHFIIDGKYAVSGAQPAEVFVNAMMLAANQ
jgi:Predicted dithiol-disulfide isomerase involved in polyketide biosynthesis